MESIISRFFLHNWQRKLLALLGATAIWFFVSHSISDVKTIPGVPIRIVNLPTDKTIIGLLPNGILSKRITLTLTGSKNVIQNIETGDLEILIDANMIDHDDWIMQINKKNLVSLNPSIDLAHHITNVTNNELVIRLRRLVTAQIPITISLPEGTAPQGYEFLDIWPQRLYQTFSGAEEEIQLLKERGLHFHINLDAVKKADLDAIKSSHLNFQDDEISFQIPDKWKMIDIPLQNNSIEEINDPDAHNLRIDFLRQELLPVQSEIPIRIFFPLKNSNTINPEVYQLDITDPVQMKNSLTIFTIPLFARNVSRLFLDIIRDNMEIAIVAAPKNERNFLLWSVEIIDPKALEDTYVAFLMNGSTNSSNIKQRESMLRERFRDYLQKLSLFTSPERKLHIESTIEGNLIKLKSEK